MPPPNLLRKFKRRGFAAHKIAGRHRMRLLKNSVFRHCEEAQSADEAISPMEDEIASLRSQ